MRVFATVALSLLGMGLQSLAAAGDAVGQAQALTAQIEDFEIQTAQASGEAAVEKLIARGDEMLALHDVGSARLLYELAADQGSAGAAAKMGMTYDPLYLRGLGVLGYTGDPQKALDWYTRAADQGDRAARSRLIRLQAHVDGEAPATAAGGSGIFSIQLAALKTERAAWEEAEWLQDTFAEFLGNKVLWVERLELSGGRGTMFGVRVEPFPDKLAADKLCAAFHAKNQGCFVVP